MRTRTSTARKDKAEVSTALVESTLNQFMTYREQKNAAETHLEDMKPIVMKLVPKGKKFTLVDGVRDGHRGKFRITVVPRDLRKPDNDRTVKLLEERGLQYAVKTVKVFDGDELAKLIQDGTITATELRELLVGVVTQYPTVVFKPGQ